MYLGFHARVMTEASASVCLILQATALFVRQATEPACVQSLCHLKNQVDTHYLARVMLACEQAFGRAGN